MLTDFSICHFTLNSDQLAANPAILSECRAQDKKTQVKKTIKAITTSIDTTDLGVFKFIGSWFKWFWVLTHTGITCL